MGHLLPQESGWLQFPLPWLCLWYKQSHCQRVGCISSIRYIGYFDCGVEPTSLLSYLSFKNRSFILSSAFLSFKYLTILSTLIIVYIPINPYISSQTHLSPYPHTLPFLHYFAYFLLLRYYPYMYSLTAGTYQP